MNLFTFLSSLWLMFQILLGRVESYAILTAEQELGLNNNTDLLEDIYMSKNISNRGLADILENFRLWQLERKKVNPTTSKPTKEPMGLEVFLPRIPEIKIDENSLGNFVKGFEHAAQDVLKSFQGPPATKPPPKLPPGATPPNELFCFLC